MNSLLVPIIMIMGGILIGVLLKTFERFIKLPYTVSLFIIGLLLGIAYEFDVFVDMSAIEQGVDLITSMDPDFVLFVFLPILIFDSAYKMDLHVFNKTLVNSSILAGPGVIICMFLTAGFVMFMSYIFGGYNPDNWKFALMFGGLISATDPVAVVALLNELKTSKRFSTLVDGESLLNDGTGIVCFMLFYSQFTGANPIQYPVMFFMWVCVASFVIGYIMAQLTLLFMTKICQREIIQNSVMVVAAYMTFLIAQSTLEVSGVIALVVFGHFFSQKALPHLKPEVSRFMSKFWEFLSEIANTLIFLIVGVIIATKVDITWTRVLEVVLLYIGLNIIRYIMITILFPILRKVGYGLKFHEAIVLGWGGLRGALGMSMALMVHYNTSIPEEIRDVILLYTAGVVALTLCVNGTTSKLLVDKFKMTKTISPFEHKLRKNLVSRFQEHDKGNIASMKSNTDFSAANWDMVECKVIPDYVMPEGTEDAVTSKDEMVAFIRKMMLEREKTLATKLYNIGVITFASYNALLDMVEILSDFDGTKPIDVLTLKTIRSQRRWFYSKKRRITGALNTCRAYLLIQEGCIKALNKVEISRVNDNEDMASAISIVREELDHIKTFAEGVIQESAKNEPEIFASTLTNRAIRVMLAKERELLNQFVEEGILEQADAESLEESIDKRQGLEIVE